MSKIDLSEHIMIFGVYDNGEGDNFISKEDLIREALPILRELYDGYKEDVAVYAEPFLDYLESLITSEDKTI